MHDGMCMKQLVRAAVDGEPFPVRSTGRTWSVAWHSPVTAPEGTPHGANAFCVTANDHIVLISNDGERWGRPGGRPEGDESWEQTLRREILEEACAIVRDARLSGSAARRVSPGREEGLVLVRFVWRVEVLAWAAHFEIGLRRLIPSGELPAHVCMKDGFEPLYHRAMIEVGLLT